MNLYQEEILEHYHNPRNYGSLSNATHQAQAQNPSCGDDIVATLIITNDTITTAQFTGSGCAISQAAMSMLTEHITGTSTIDAQQLTKDDILELLGVELSPNRLRCGLLALEAVHAALQSPKT